MGTFPETTVTHFAPEYTGRNPRGKDHLNQPSIFRCYGCYCRVPKGGGVFKGGGNWGTLRIPFGKIGEP